MAQAIEYDISDVDLVAAAAHELKNPLAFISSAAAVIREQNVLSPKQQQQYLNRICLSADRMLNIVDSLLGAKKLRSGRRVLQLDPQHAETVIDEVIAELETFAHSRKQKLGFKKLKKTRPVLIDSTAFHHAVYNLLDNAIKYSPAESTISLSLKKTKHHLQVRISSASQPISQDDWRRLREQFTISDQPITAHADSNGLGLMVAAQLARLMSGFVGFYSKGGQNCFYIAVPLTDQLSLFK